MPFSQATIAEASALRDGADLVISWTSSAAAGTTFQVYVSHRLAYHGTRRWCSLPYPTDAGGSTVPVAIGAVGVGEEQLDFSASLPALGYANRARLKWYGGTFQAENIAGFHVYRGAIAGGSVSYASPLATLSAYPQNRVIDGAGRGPAGRGGAGRSASTYRWDSEPLSPGTWHFGVKPFDAGGNEGSALEATFAVTAPPEPPAPDSTGRRLVKQSYNSTTGVATLIWNASPSA